MAHDNVLPAEEIWQDLTSAIAALEDPDPRVSALTCKRLPIVFWRRARSSILLRCTSSIFSCSTRNDWTHPGRAAWSAVSL